MQLSFPYYTLADFLHIEIKESCQVNPDSEMVDIAANAINNAIKQLESVERAILELQL